MSGPFSRRNPYDNEPTELSSRWSFYKTKRQQLKDKRDAERRQALLNQNNIIRQQKFTPTPISDINIDSLPPEAQSEALIAEANASNPNPALREENKGWFSKLMQKWDDSTVQGAGSPLNPFNAVINVFNPNAARQLEIKRRRYKREYKDSGLSEREAQLKKELMYEEFKLNMQLKEADLNVIKDKEKYKEDRKDDRTKIQASQQSKLIDQRKNNKPPQNFESDMGFDTLGGFGMEQFEPR